MDALTFVVDALAPLNGKSVLDVGCGRGALAKALIARGAKATGIDPNSQTIAAARLSVPEVTFEVGSAEALPFADGWFDSVVLLNSLHHVADPRRGLAEASRVVRASGVVVVVEPLAQGSANAALRPIEDEAAVRAIAQEAIAAALAEGTFEALTDAVFERIERLARVEDFFARVVAVDPARAAAIEADRAAIVANFERVAERDAEGRYFLRQPLRGIVLRPRASGGATGRGSAAA